MMKKLEKSKQPKSSRKAGPPPPASRLNLRLANIFPSQPPSTSHHPSTTNKMSSPASEDEEAASMAALMGFSTFGSHKPPAKKRKFNASTDAFVEGQELAKLDRGEEGGG